MNFGEAIEAVKEGKLIAREGWNGKGMFVFQRPEDTLSINTLVDHIRSLPQSVKEYFRPFKSVHDTNSALDLGHETVVKFTAYLCMKAADNTIVNGWLASQTDMLAEDWTILE